MERKYEAPVRGPRFFHHVYSDTRLALLWLPLRLYAGYAWITASLPKVTNPQWVQTVETLKKFWQSGKQIFQAPSGAC